MLTSHWMPNRSTHMPKTSPHGAWLSGMTAVPPSASVRAGYGWACRGRRMRLGAARSADGPESACQCQLVPVASMVATPTLVPVLLPPFSAVMPKVLFSRSAASCER
jgi:hypothetical protein